MREVGIWAALVTPSEGRSANVFESIIVDFFRGLSLVMGLLLALMVVVMVAAVRYAYTHRYHPKKPWSAVFPIAQLVLLITFFAVPLYGEPDPLIAMLPIWSYFVPIGFNALVWLWMVFADSWVEIAEEPVVELKLVETPQPRRTPLGKLRRRSSLKAS